MLGFWHFRLYAGRPMSIESQLRDKLRKIETLFAGASTAGERLTAEAALERVRTRLAAGPADRDAILDARSLVEAFVSGSLSALRIGVVSLSSPETQHDYGARAEGFIEQVLWSEFSELDRALQIYLHEVTLRVIREEVYSDASEAQEVPDALPPN